MWRSETSITWRRHNAAPPRTCSYTSIGVNAGLAQLVVHLICNQGVGGSNPSAGTIPQNVYSDHIGDVL
jgi:hypothetical protein